MDTRNTSANKYQDQKAKLGLNNMTQNCPRGGTIQRKFLVTVQADRRTKALLLKKPYVPTQQLLEVMIKSLW